MCIVRGEGSAFLEQPSPEFEAALSEPSRRILTYLRTNGASFLHDIRNGAHLSLDAMNNGIAELFWNGLITNDIFAELLSIKRFAKTAEEKPLEPIDLVTGRRNPYRFKAMQSVRKALKQVPGWSGRWSLVHLPGVLGPELTLDAKAEAQAMVFLNRYGIFAREFYKHEELLPWRLIASQLQRMEMRGEIRRGFFVEGMSGMQFALPAAVEELRRLRSLHERDDATILINACDPANPLGAGRLTPDIQLARVPSAFLAFHRGSPILLIEGNGRLLRTLGENSNDTLHSALRQFAALLTLPEPLRPFREITVELCNGQRAAESSLAPLLASIGFRRDANQSLRYDGYA
jgi:ATP-dependent Lhr-like helicase